MESRRPSDLSLPYGKIAIWGIAVSVVVTGGYLALAPCSPARLAAQALDGRASLSGALLPDGRHLPTAAEFGRRAVEDVLGGGEGRRGSHDGRAPDWLRIVPDLDIGGEWLHATSDIGAEIAREWSRVAPGVRAEVAREWRKVAPELRDELRRELRRELRGLRVEVDASPPEVSVGGA